MGLLLFYVAVYLASENHPKGNEDRENVLILVHLIATLDWNMISIVAVNRLKIIIKKNILSLLPVCTFQSRS